MPRKYTNESMPWMGSNAHYYHKLNFPHKIAGENLWGNFTKTGDFDQLYL